MTVSHHAVLLSVSATIPGFCLSTTLMWSEASAGKCSMTSALNRSRDRCPRGRKGRARLRCQPRVKLMPDPSRTRAEQLEDALDVIASVMHFVDYVRFDAIQQT